ncbi:PREDICTED: uncharacterized protein LOC101310158 [Fragaria vesca subsp. vesca]|uniref:uncharacterized protein LOC101310158 n=1 Tax=Fragaria vesca subsp. vesca TaxID=101020 RepID=UPI0002C30104|nr:PREDICTED: uncharacterized protein LOC101310158 [Fragaria vesca subsp. vesca]XP_011464618.1 PREDICTED: uncharacterized protein LOC101310158 [Fragaria vesca subsp. vesca]
MEMLKEAGKMIVEGAGGAVLGSACESFLKSIGKCCMFDYPVLESVKSTVENLKEMIPKMEDHNMKLGDRKDEVKELKEEMERGTRLLDELPDFNKLSYNDQLVELDASLKSLVKKLRLQSALDVKEVLVSTKENSKVVKKNTRVVKCTKRKVDAVDETVKDIKKMQKVIMNIMKKQKVALLECQVEHALEGAALLGKLLELDDVLQDPTLQVPVAYAIIEWFQNIKRITQRMPQIFELVERKTAENEDLTYIPIDKTGVEPSPIEMFRKFHVSAP